MGEKGIGARDFEKPDRPDKPDKPDRPERERRDPPERVGPPEKLDKPDVHKEIREVEKNFPEVKASPSPEARGTGQQGDGKAIDKGVKEAPGIPQVPKLN
jgi:hypothetical protein